MDSERSITITAGNSRTGKSTFALRYLLNAPLAYRFVFDAETGPQSYAVRLNFPQATDELTAGLHLCNGWVLYNPHFTYPGRLAQGFADFCLWTFEICKRLPGRKALVIDEAWRYVSPHRYPGELAACVQSGSAYGLGCVFNTQMPHKLHEAIQNECSEVVCFRLGGDKSLAWAADKGLNATAVEALPKFHFIARNVESRGELRGALEP